MTENMRERAEDWNQESVNANETNRPDRLEPAHIWRDTGIDYLLVFNQSVMQLWRRSKTLARRGGDVKTLRVDPPFVPSHRHGVGIYQCDAPSQRSIENECLCKTARCRYAICFNLLLRE